MLSRLIGAALLQNFDLARALARVSQTRASLRSATAKLLPSGEVEGGASRSQTSVDTPVGSLLSAAPGFERTVNSYEADLSASWELDLFGGLRRGRESARSFYEAARADVAAARLAVAAQTADTYVTIRGLQTRIAIIRELIDRQQKLLATVTLQFNKGVAAPLQVHQTQGALAQVQSILPELSIELDAAMNALDVLLGVQPGTYRAELLAPASVPAAPTVLTAGGPAALIRRRPDLIAAERRLQASNAQIGVAIAEYFPKFSLAGLIGSASTQSAAIFSGNAGQGQGVLGLRWRLFDFGRVDAEVAAARGRHAEALATYRLAVLRATEDVENSLSRLLNRETQERELAEGESSLQQAYDASLASYKAGAVSLIEVLDADTRLLATQDARARAKAQAARAAIASFRALGGGWDAETSRAGG
jgi:NodT family efflux transporter outer membrane factor (OMF) lipoprotein